MVGLFPFQMAFSWLMNGGYQSHTGMILQAVLDFSHGPALPRSPKDGGTSDAQGERWIQHGDVSLHSIEA